MRSPLAAQPDDLVCAVTAVASAGGSGGKANHQGGGVEAPTGNECACSVNTFVSF